MTINKGPKTIACETIKLQDKCSNIPTTSFQFQDRISPQAIIEDIRAERKHKNLECQVTTFVEAGINLWPRLSQDIKPIFTKNEKRGT